MAERTSKGVTSLLELTDNQRPTITILPEPVLTFPDLYLAVTILGNASDFAYMFVKAKCYKAKNLPETDLLVFTGGADVNPELYGSKSRHHLTRCDLARDDADKKMFDLAVKQGIPMLGICRGSQFLHVMNGGQLFQDVNGHLGDHSITDKVTGETIGKVSSTHHQMAIPNDRMKVLATTKKSWKRSIDAQISESGRNEDIEAFFYEDTCSLGIQGHPEFRNYGQYTQWSLNLIQEYICKNPQVEATKVSGGTVSNRLKKEFRKKGGK